MKLRRIMSPEEFKLFLSGVLLEKLDDFSQKARSASTGFCFFGEEVPVEKHVNWLPGVRSEDVVVTFSCDDASVTESWGEYAEGEGRVREYCTKQYSKETFSVVKLESVTKYGTFHSREEEKRAKAYAEEARNRKPRSRT